jgi:hypothetical protein
MHMDDAQAVEPGWGNKTKWLGTRLISCASVCTIWAGCRTAAGWLQIDALCEWVDNVGCGRSALSV